MSDRSKVTLVLSEREARWLRDAVWQARLDPALLSTEASIRLRINDEIRHALAECDCAGEVGR